MTPDKYLIEPKAATLTAAQCDDVQVARAVSRVRDNMARRWPMNICAAVQWLQLRGFNATDEFIHEYAKRKSLVDVGEITLTGQQVEQIAEELAAAGMFNEWALQRASEGVTGARFVEMMQENAIEKKPFYVGKIAGNATLIIGNPKTSFENYSIAKGNEQIFINQIEVPK
jgi:hypothetical protein